ncbi:uncharacterized protein [Tenebrio molitor]|uniref:uncharacterized protein n=1 Tax=Tenebrio molitor TaxID=7067 RepID=UPI00362489D5
MKRIKTINENQINCCEDDEVVDAASEVNDTESLDSEDDINILRGEIRYLKSLMEHKEYLRPFVSSIFSCEKLKSKRPEVYSFRVSLPAFELEKVMDPQVWPQGISINR